MLRGGPSLASSFRVQQGNDAAGQEAPGDPLGWTNNAAGIEEGFRVEPGGALGGRQRLFGGQSGAIDQQTLDAKDDEHRANRHEKCTPHVNRLLWLLGPGRIRTSMVLLRKKLHIVTSVTRMAGAETFRTSDDFAVGGERATKASEYDERAS